MGGSAGGTDTSIDEYNAETGSVLNANGGAEGNPVILTTVAVGQSAQLTAPDNVATQTGDALCEIAKS